MKTTKDKSLTFKHFLTFCFAGFISILTLFSTACSPTQSSISNPHQISSEPNTLGLNPETDPVVYTTASGLEIKMSNADKFAGTSNFITNTNISVNQDLTSFYYFTMGTYSGTLYTGKTQTETYNVSNAPINWIILGVGSHSNAFVESVSNYLFSTIKNNDYLFSNGEYYFDNQHETFSPAGQLIDSVVSSKTYIMGKVKDSIVVNTEIPKGCMLVLSEKLLGQMYFNADGNVNARFYTENPNCYLIYGQNYYGNRYRFIASNTSGNTWTTSDNAGGSLYNYINNLFSKNISGTILKNSLGFTQVQSDLIIPQQLNTVYYDGTNYKQDTPSTDGGTYYTMFPLAYKGISSSISQNFCVETYLSKSNQIRVASLIGSNYAYYWHLRTGYARIAFNSSISSLGAYDNAHFTSNGVRPAMVMKLQ